MKQYDKQFDNAYYNSVFPQIANYDCHYKQSYYFRMWKLGISWIKKLAKKTGKISILEIGSGPGQFAHLLWDRGFRDYIGFDFSEWAVNKARSVSPQKFFLCNAYDKSCYENIHYNLVILFEVLEHVEKDIDVLNNVKNNSFVLASVPAYKAEGHVRGFIHQRHVIKRYGKILDIKRMETIFTESGKPKWHIFLSKKGV